MRIYRDTKIFVIAPANVHSGGPELLHQLASRLVNLNFDARMFYTPKSNADSIHPNYKKYRLPFAEKIEDEPHNVVITPETGGWALYDYKNIQRVFWWLSVDNFINNVSNIIDGVKEGRGKNYLRQMPKFFWFNDSDETIEHWVQSEYARRFVSLNGVDESRIKVVRDYLHPTFLRRAPSIDLNAKQNIIAFNPNKGFAFTRKLIAASPGLAWAPIRNMTTEQVQNLLARAKVYVDFGNHPGRDRIPREAAVSGCVLITGRRGSAGNPIDIAIDDSFKFDDTEENVPKIVERIKNVFADFGAEHSKQKEYRAEIIKEPETFAREVEAACEFVEPIARPTRCAILQSLTLEKNLDAFLKMIDHLPNYELSFALDDEATNGDESGASRRLLLKDRTDGSARLRLVSIPLVSTEEAAFLYRERRIEKFVVHAPTDEEKRLLGEACMKIQIRAEDLMTLKTI